MSKPDIEISTDGIAILRGLTKRGTAWLRRHVVSSESLGNPIEGIPCEIGYAQDIAAGALRGDLQVSVDGYPCAIGKGGTVVRVSVEATS